MMTRGQMTEDRRLRAATRHVMKDFAAKARQEFCPLSSERGFSLISAIFLLVVIAALGTFAVTLSTTQHQSAALDVMGSRAYQAARAGVEWAAYHVASSPANATAAWTGCAQNTPLSSLGGTMSSFTVTVNCSAASHPEGTDASGATNYIWIYDVSAVAKAGTVGEQGYVERVISVKLGK